MRCLPEDSVDLQKSLFFKYVAIVNCVFVRGKVGWKKNPKTENDASLGSGCRTSAPTQVWAQYVDVISFTTEMEKNLVEMKDVYVVPWISQRLPMQVYMMYTPS